MTDPVAGAGSPARVGRPSLVLLVVLAVALATGAAASILLGAATAPGAPAQPASEYVVPATWIADGLLGVFAVIAFVLVYQRLTRGAATLSSRAVLTFLVVILLGVAFVAAAQFFHPGGCPWCGGSTPGSAPPPSGNNSTATGSNNTPPGGGGNLVFLSWHVPAWLEFAALALVTLLVAAVVMPLLAQWSTARRLRGAGPVRPGSGPTAEEVRVAFARASRDLDLGLGPREVIERLYADLLERLGRYVTQIDPFTPEEIRVQHLVRLGIRTEVATELTRLFEEARYSSHPLGLESADRAAEAVRRATADLERTQEVA